ncbi:hypothetical protein ASPZODRAFT_134060 [Penicilliopsis zonata CBS 506.65]|uniref:Uncharacterized protein n=1 Tax=Penicilliopsis zonata CBS 506.65 TaxID=1073090 RepID=A0A1L9SE75_9EURO|nr:hypothetical protein ASPZODRAFT_134060 [Penicilliopsis zonata CBS 506.65]OJJ45408.1 hypothetical protein ASPZODRAFT_134060 [Penicilliopsis zonata CBS 506.65]
MSPATRLPIWARGVVSDIETAPETFSSWDKCMEKAYCKYVRYETLESSPIF